MQLFTQNDVTILSSRKEQAKNVPPLLIIPPSEAVSALYVKVFKYVRSD